MSDMDHREFDEILKWIVPFMQPSRAKRSRREMWARRVIGALEATGFKIVKYRPAWPGKPKCDNCGWPVELNSSDYYIQHPESCACGWCHSTRTAS